MVDLSLELENRRDEEFLVWTELQIGACLGCISNCCSRSLWWVGCHRCLSDTSSGRDLIDAGAGVIEGSDQSSQRRQPVRLLSWHYLSLFPFSPSPFSPHYRPTPPSPHYCRQSSPMINGSCIFVVVIGIAGCCAVISCCSAVLLF